jgi:hypothetical protein
MAQARSDSRGAFDQSGFCVVPDVLSAPCRRNLSDLFGQNNAWQARHAGAVDGARNLLANPDVLRLARSRDISAVMESLIGEPARAVRGLFFDKTAEANWHVPWHQDVVLAVAERHDIAGWGPWTVKAGVPHVEAPADLLARMVTLRLHLDDCDEDNGPLRVLPGSQDLGRLRNDDIKGLREKMPACVCLAPAGAALAMRPLLVHASSPARSPRHRRVLHLEFAPAQLLPPPLKWRH